MDPELESGYSSWRAYAQSKVAATALGLEADRRLRAERVPVASVVAHPGYSTSGRTAGIAGVNEPSRLTRFFDNLQAPVTQSKQAGALPLVQALAGEGVEGGTFWGPRFVAHGMPRPAKPSKVTRDEEVGGRLWAYCQEATGVHWPERPRRTARRR